MGPRSLNALKNEKSAASKTYIYLSVSTEGGQIFFSLEACTILMVINSAINICAVKATPTSHKLWDPRSSTFPALASCLLTELPRHGYVETTLY